MVETRGLRLGASAAAKEKRLVSLLAGRGLNEADLAAAVEAAQVAGSLELSGGAAGAGAAAALLAARRAVSPEAPFSVALLRAWNRALTGVDAYRSRERDREGGPPPAPPEFIPTRLAVLEQWLGVQSSRELKPAEQGALVLARIVEILPFEAGSGRVARLAASHVMVRAGSRPPILMGGDRGRLDACLQAAFQLQTEPLVRLLEEAAERALDVMISELEKG